MSGKWEAEECFAVQCSELFWFQFALPTLRLEGLDGCLVFPGFCVCWLTGGGGVLLKREWPTVFGGAAGDGLILEAVCRGE